MQTTAALTGGRLATVSTTTVGLLAVGSREHSKRLVVDDGRVVRVDHDDFVVLVLPVLANPVRVEHFEVGEVAVHTLFSDALRVLGHGDLGDTSLGWLTLHVNLTLAKSTTADTGADEDDTLLGLVSQAASSIETCWALDAAVDRLAAPLCHTRLSEHVRESLFWLLPGFTNVLCNAHLITSSGWPSKVPFMSLPTCPQLSKRYRNRYTHA